MKSSALYHLWKRQVFLRNRHQDFDRLLTTRRFSSGIYLIGCAGEIVYVGQSWDLVRRSIESLGNHYHRVADTKLPWSIAFAPCSPDEMDELESTAIRTYAPRFNTSLPSIAKSLSRMPEVVGSAAVFQDQKSDCGAFHPENLRRQVDTAAQNSEPPWAVKKTRRKTERKSRRQPEIALEPVEWTEKEAAGLVQAHGVSLSEPLRFKINLCEDGSVITKDGEVIGTWTMDENAHPSFFPDGATEPLIFDVFLGLLCQRVAEWYEAEKGDKIG